MPLSLPKLVRSLPKQHPRRNLITNTLVECIQPFCRENLYKKTSSLPKTSSKRINTTPRSSPTKYFHLPAASTHISRTASRIQLNSCSLATPTAEKLSSRHINIISQDFSQTMAHKTDAEQHVKRNPHPDFKSVESQRPEWDTSAHWVFTKTKNPSWKLGDGANDNGASLKKEHISIDPYEEGRPAVHNYKLLISSIIPRPIGFVSTRSKDGTSTNLAPFSYTNVVNHDPPVFTIGYAGGFDKAKDSLRNLMESGECVINIISEHFLEAANASSINAPYGTSEWALTGLTPADSIDVKASRVKEAVFSIEGKLMDTKEFESKSKPGNKSGVLAIIEGVRFWAREDAINEERNLIDPDVLRPMSRLGGITYGRTSTGIEIPRPDFEKQVHEDHAENLVQSKAEGQ